jgi:hypothetical protein
MTPDNSILNCPVCRESLSKPASSNLVGTGEWQSCGLDFECRHCGNFSVEQLEYDHLLGYLNPPKNVPGVNVSPLQVTRHRAVLAHALRRMQAFGQKPVLTDGVTIRILKEDRLPSLIEQRDNVLRWFHENVEMGTARGISWDVLGARVGTASPGAFQLLLESMLAQGLMDGNLGSDASGQLRLTYRGLERLEQLERATPSGYNAFMAMRFGDSVLDNIVDAHFRPAVKDAGFQLLRLDDRPEAGLIDARLRNEIRNCRFLIADLSHSNAGSYWEAGYAEGLGKPVIYTCEKSVFDGKTTFERPHFDTNHHWTIIWQADNPQLAADQLKETIKFTIPEARQTN